uniref:FtsX-like permease family protein n=1 Tax=Desulfobacca acetoxidans TaxID=60893 RepID=A0A7C3YYG2_9BACT
MKGILKVAFKLLVNDRGKFVALLVGITFAVFLIVQLTSVFAGILTKASATIINIGAPVWVMDPAVNNPLNSIQVPDYLLDRVRSIDGVNYAVPLYSGVALVKLQDGFYQPCTILGLDDSSLVGRPKLIEGNIEDIFAENGFIVVKDSEFHKLENPTLGTTFEINDHRAVVIGIAEVTSSTLFGIPTLYTTFSRAIQYIPSPRFTIAYILVEPKSGKDIPRIKEEVAKAGYLALTDQEFQQRVSNYYKYQTGVGTNILIMTMTSFLVGLSICGQTFYTFVLENLSKFGALKAIGAKSYELIAMILFQTLFTGLTGYGLGVGFSSLLIALAKRRISSYAADITFYNLGLAFVLVLIISAISSFIAVRKVIKVEPFDIFRG